MSERYNRTSVNIIKGKLFQVVLKKHYKGLQGTQGKEFFI